MGCCASRPHGGDQSSDSDAGQTPTGQPPVTQQAGTQNNGDTLQTSTASLLETARSQALRQRHASSSRLSKAVQSARKGKPFSKAPAPAQIEAPLVSMPDGEPAPASSMALLQKARMEFYETRVTGSPEMWNVIRMTCGLVEDGALDDARAILEAAGGICPTGILWGKQGGCFDERGERYVVPAWCLGCPQGIESEPQSLPLSLKEDEKINWETEDPQSPTSGSYSTEAKGKGKLTNESFTLKGKELRVKIRYSHTARDETFTIGDENMLESLAQLAKQKSAISYDTKVRFVYLGRLLDHKRSLSEIDWRKDQILSLFVFE